MRPRRDVIVYGANQASVESLSYVLSVRLHARLVVVASLNDLATAIRSSVNCGCVVIVCHGEERARLKAFVRACGDVRTLQVRLGSGRAVLQDRDSPCTLSIPFLPMDAVLERVKTLCARKRGPTKRSAAAAMERAA